MHTQLSSGNGCLNVGMNIQLCPYLSRLLGAIGEGSGETARMLSLVWFFVVQNS